MYFVYMDSEEVYDTVDGVEGWGVEFGRFYRYIEWEGICVRQ